MITHHSIALVQAPSSPDDRSSEFVPVTGGSETANATSLLLAAYILMWACAFGLIWLSIKKLASVAARMEELEKQLAKRDAETQTRSTP